MIEINGTMGRIFINGQPTDVDTDDDLLMAIKCTLVRDPETLAAYLTKYHESMGIEDKLDEPAINIITTFVFKWAKRDMAILDDHTYTNEDLNLVIEHIRKQKRTKEKQKEQVRT